MSREREQQRLIRRLEGLRIERWRLILRLREVRAEMDAAS